MTTFDYDLFVIGAGSGGVRAARLASSTYGAKTAVAEEYRVGGTCVIRGCVPKKLMVYASEYGHALRQAKGFGWQVEGARFDWTSLMTGVHAEVDRLSAIYGRNLAAAGVEVIDERAEVVGPHAVRLAASGRTVTAKTILIATGARPYRPLDLAGQEHGVTSNEVFKLARKPERVIVVGGGYVACEFAGVFNGLGAETRLLHRGDALLRGFDSDVRAAVRAEMERKGVRVITEAVLTSIEKRGEGDFMCRLADGAAFEADLVMFAIGRSPNTHGLGLESAVVALTETGAVKVDAYSRSSAPSIWAVGDVTDRVQLTPVALREGAAFAATCFGGQMTAFDHDTIASAVFTQPPVGSVGLTEADARKRFGEIDIYKTDFRAMRHALTGEGERVLMKLVVRRADQVVIGVHMVGADAAEIIQMAGIAVKAGLTKAAWDATCAVHPTIAEEFVTLREAAPPPQSKAAE